MVGIRYVIDHTYNSGVSILYEVYIRLNNYLDNYLICWVCHHDTQPLDHESHAYRYKCTNLHTRLNLLIKVICTGFFKIRLKIQLLSAMSAAYEYGINNRP